MVFRPINAPVPGLLVVRAYQAADVFRVPAVAEEDAADRPDARRNEEAGIRVADRIGGARGD